MTFMNPKNKTNKKNAEKAEKVSRTFSKYTLKFLLPAPSVRFCYCCLLFSYDLAFNYKIMLVVSSLQDQKQKIQNKDGKGKSESTFLFFASLCKRRNAFRAFSFFATLAHTHTNTSKHSEPKTTKNMDTNNFDAAIAFKTNGNGYIKRNLNKVLSKNKTQQHHHKTELK